MPTLALAVDPSGVVAGTTVAKRAMRTTSAEAGRLKSSIAGMVGAFAVFAGLRSAIRTIADFEVAMQTLRGVTGATETQLIALEETARHMGATTRYSATEAAEGLLFLARAGFTVTEAITALPATLDLATAGAIGLGEAADIASNILSQFGLKAAETSRISDVLVSTANSANTSVSQLAEALKYAGPFAGQLGISVEETAAAIGVLGDSGVQASLAGTNMRGMLAGLLKPTDAANDALDRMNLTLAELSPTSGDLVGVFEKLRPSVFGAQEAVELFGRRNAVAALIIANSTKKLRALTIANKESDEVARRNAEMIEDTLVGAYKSFTSALQEATLAAGDGGLMGAARGLVDALTIVARDIGGVETSTVEASRGVRLLAGAIEGLIAAGTLLALKKLVFTLGGAAAALSPTGALIVGTAAAIGFFSAMTVEVDDLGRSLTSLGSRAEMAANKLKRAMEAGDTIRQIEAMREQAAILRSMADEMAVSEGEFMRVPLGIPRRAEILEHLEGMRTLGDLVANASRAGQTTFDWERIQHLLAAIDKEAVKLDADIEALTSSLGELNPAELTALEEAVARVVELQDEVVSDDTIENARLRAEQLGHAIGDPINRALQDVLFFADDWGRSLEYMLRNMAANIWQVLIGQRITAGFVGLFAGGGGGGYQPNITQKYAGFQHGGIIGGPTMFAHAGGLGMMGERGPEAVMPLGRDANGDMGVRVIGGGQAVNVHMTVVTQDAGSFRRSQRQIVADLKRGLSRRT